MIIAAGHASQVSALKTSQDGMDVSSAATSFCDAVPSSTQAVFKTGSTAITNIGSRGSQSVSKQADVKAAGQDAAGGQVGKSPTEPVRMLAVKAEFERRLEKQVSLKLLCSLNVFMLLQMLTEHIKS